MQTAPTQLKPTGFTRDLLGDLDSTIAEKVVSAGGDVAMIIDSGGVIRDLALGNNDLLSDGFGAWLDKRWADTVTAESRHKVEEMLREAANDSGPRWRELNHPTDRGASIALRFIALGAGKDGRVIAIGRDHRAVEQLQQRLVLAQQGVERDYVRLRDAESRYRLLFQLASEAVIVVDAGNKKIVEANPAADRLVGGAEQRVKGRAFADVFDVSCRDAAVELLAMAQTGARVHAQTTLTGKGRSFSAAASLFRQDRSALYLVRLTPLEQSTGDTVAKVETGNHLVDVVEAMPDGFVVTDEKLNILTANNAFLDITRLASKEQACAHTLDEFLGRPGVDRNILVTTLREHGSVTNFASVMRSRFGGQEDVEVSAVFVPTGATPCYGFTIRTVARAVAAVPRAAGNLPRSVEQLSHLVGRVTLKELVRESTDLVERLCIEAALELTGNNRASAAEVLGLSRQSLYSKLHRFGLADFAGES